MTPVGLSLMVGVVVVLFVHIVVAEPEDEEDDEPEETVLEEGEVAAGKMV